MTSSEILDLIVASSNNESIFHEGKELERNGMFLVSENFLFPSEGGSIFHFGWLLALGKKVELNIVLICSDLAFRFLREDGKNVIILKFCENEILNNQNTMIVGVSGLCTFHQIDKPSDEFFNDLGIIDAFDFSTMLDTLGSATNHSNNIILDEDEDNLRHYPDIEEPSMAIAEPESDSDLDLNFINDEHQLDRIVSKMYDLSSKEILTSTDRIDYLSSSNKMKNEFDVEFTQTFDIDGIFLFTDFKELSNIIQCPMTIYRNPSKSLFRDINCLKNTFGETFNLMNNSKLVKYGSLRLEHGSFEIFIACGVNSNDRIAESKIDMLDLENSIKAATSFANKFPCNRFSDHSEMCKTLELRLQRESSIPLNGLKEDQLPAELVPCFLYHLEREIFRIVNINGLNLKFYLRMVGMKSLLVTSNFEKIGDLLEDISNSINFLRLPDNNVAVDFCIQSVPRDKEERIQVN